MFRMLPSIVALLGVMAVHASAQAPAAASKAAPAALVNLNTATARDLEVLPGIGERTAARIIEYRQKNGPFKKIEDLMNVGGIGEKTFLRLKPQLTVASSKPDRPGDSAGR
jgi:competence protein ComEA